MYPSFYELLPVSPVEGSVNRGSCGGAKLHHTNSTAASSRTAAPPICQRRPVSRRFFCLMCLIQGFLIYLTRDYASTELAKTFEEEGEHVKGWRV